MGKKVVLVTGAFSGIGKATAKRFLKEGHIVYAVDFTAKSDPDLEKLKGKTSYMDVRDDKSVKQGIAKVIKEQDKIDILINNAGYAQYGSLEDVTIEQAKAQFETNVFGYVRTIKEVLPSMRKQRSGHIINITSTAGKINAPLVTWYGSSKFALEGLFDAFRNEVSSFGIKVVMIEPGFINTGLYDVAEKFLAKVKTSSHYAKMKKIFWKGIRSRQAASPTGEVIADAIYKAGMSKDPKTRYALPKDAKKFLFWRKLLSDKTFDKFIRKEMGLK